MSSPTAISALEVLSITGATALLLSASLRAVPDSPSRRWFGALASILVAHLLVVSMVPYGPWHANGHDISRWGMTRMDTVLHGFPQPNAHGQTAYYLPWLVARVFPWIGSFLFTSAITLAGLAAFAAGTRRLTGSGAAALGATALLALHPFTVRLAPSGAYGPAIGGFLLIVWWAAERWRARPTLLHATATAAAASLLAQVHAECLGLTPLILVAWIVARAPLSRDHLRQLGLAALLFGALLVPRLTLILVDTTAGELTGLYDSPNATLKAWRTLLYLLALVIARTALPTLAKPRAHPSWAAAIAFGLAGIALTQVTWPSPGDPFLHAQQILLRPAPLELFNTTLANPAIGLAAMVGAAFTLLRGGRALVWLPLPLLLAVPYTPVRENLANRVEWSTASLQATAVLAAIGLAQLHSRRMAILLGALGGAALLPPYLPWMTHRFPDQAWAQVLVAARTPLTSSEAVAIEHHITPEEQSTSLLYRHAFEQLGTLNFSDVLAAPSYSGILLIPPSCYMALKWDMTRAQRPLETVELRQDAPPVILPRGEREQVAQPIILPPLHTFASCHHEPSRWTCVMPHPGGCRAASIPSLPDCEPSPPYERADCAAIRDACDLDPIAELEIGRVNPHGNPFLVLHDAPVIGVYQARCGAARRASP